jgi:hypothetical protein
VCFDNFWVIDGKLWPRNSKNSQKLLELRQIGLVHMLQDLLRLVSENFGSPLATNHQNRVVKIFTGYLLNRKELDHLLPRATCAGFLESLLNNF